MNNEIFPGGYIQRTIVEPEKVTIPIPQRPTPEVITQETVPATVPEVAGIEKLKPYIPWIIAGISMVFSVIAITRRKKGE